MDDDDEISAAATTPLAAREGSSLGSVAQPVVRKEPNPGPASAVARESMPSRRQLPAPPLDSTLGAETRTLSPGQSLASTSSEPAQHDASGNTALTSTTALVLQEATYGRVMMDGDCVYDSVESIVTANAVDLDNSIYATVEDAPSRVTHAAPAAHKPTKDYEVPQSSASVIAGGSEASDSNPATIEMEDTYDHLAPVAVAVVADSPGPDPNPDHTPDPNPDTELDEGEHEEPQCPPPPPPRSLASIASAAGVAAGSGHHSGDSTSDYELIGEDEEQLGDDYEVVENVRPIVFARGAGSAPATRQQSFA